MLQTANLTLVSSLEKVQLLHVSKNSFRLQGSCV